MADGCIFCAILRGDAPAHRVYEDDRAVAFMDLFPVVEGHTLIVTKAHSVNLLDADPEDISAVGRCSVPLVQALHRAFAPDGVSVYQANGAAAGQTVFHYHMHLMPRKEGSALVLHGRTRAEDETLAAVAARIRAALPEKETP